MWLMNVVVTDGEDKQTVALRAPSFSELLKEYTRFLRTRDSIPHEEDVDASLVPPAPIFETGMVRLRS